MFIYIQIPEKLSIRELNEFDFLAMFYKSSIFNQSDKESILFYPQILEFVLANLIIWEKIEFPKSTIVKLSIRVFIRLTSEKTDYNFGLHLTRYTRFEYLQMSHVNLPKFQIVIIWLLASLNSRILINAINAINIETWSI